VSRRAAFFLQRGAKFSEAMRKERYLMKTKIVRNILLSLGVIFTLAAALPTHLPANIGDLPSST
jgi:hypothetical protein